MVGIMNISNTVINVQGLNEQATVPASNNKLETQKMLSHHTRNLTRS